MSPEDGILLFAGSESQALGHRVAQSLGIELGTSEVTRFSDGNLFVRILRTVRRREAYVIQGISGRPNDNFVELLFWIDALKGASAEKVTAVIPYFSYAKGDKKDEPRVSIRARVCADALEAAGVDRVVTLDLHAPQIQGFFKVPVDDLHAMPLLCDRVRDLELDDPVVVSPDSGFVKRARSYALRLKAGLAIADKERFDHSEQPSVLEIIGDVRDKTAIIVDDFTITAGTLTEVARFLADSGARRILAAVTHAPLSEGAVDRIEQSPIERLIVTDSVSAHASGHSAKLEVLSVADLFAEAIRRIHEGESVSVLFE